MSTDRFVLRYSGPDERQNAEAIEISPADPVEVIDRTSNMLLVKGAQADVEKLVNGLSGWRVMPERKLAPVRSLRPQIKRSR
jgi:hypothetical protein